MKNYTTLFTRILGTKPFRLLKGGILTFALATSVNAQQTYTFTNAGATGSLGPTQGQVNAAYSASNLNGSVTINIQGIQEFTIPVTGGYRIEARGASGYGTFGGRGAIMAGDFTLTAGTVLKIAVGQQGAPPNNSQNQYGGGGGSFVTYTNNTALVVAGGGGGSWATSFTGSSDGTVTTNGRPGVNGSFNGAGGTNGSGGLNASSADGGGGLTGNGGGGAGGLAYINGATGGSNRGHGGFGGGAGTSSWDNRRGGGGGGYSGGGGAAANSSASGNPEGGGGGSFNAGVNQTNSSGANTGMGLVIIRELCAINISRAGTNSLGEICSGNSATLTTNAVSNYSWSTGATSSSIVVSPTVNTIYTLTAMSVSNCVAIATVAVNVNAAIPTLTLNTSNVTAGGACPNSTIALTASGASTYTWTGNVNNGVPFTPGGASGYTVSGENACGTVTAATSVSIHPAPPVTASASQPSVCSGNTVTVVGSGASTYTWNVSGISNGVPFSPTQTQTYIVTGSSAFNCTASAAVIVSVTTTPILAPIATPTRICFGETATITASGAANYSWSPGNESSAAITVTPGSTSTYTVVKWNDNCFDTKTITVLVDQLPNVLAFTNNSVICIYNTTTLQAGGGQSYTWAPQGGQGPNSFTTIVSPQVSTNYTVTAFDGNCTNSATLDVIVNPNPTITIAASNSVICNGQSVTMTASGGQNYQWSAGLSGNPVTATPTAPVLYTVSGTNSFGCTGVASQIVLVNTLPVITTTVSQPLVCAGNSSTLSAAGAHTYVWSAGTTPNGAATVVNPNVNTVYTVTGTFTNTTCSDSRTVAVAVFDPSFAVNSNTSVCFGGAITLTASGAISYTWNSGTQGPAITVSPTVATVYTVNATSISGSVSCPSSNTVEVTIYQNPVVTAVATRTSICRNESVDLNAGGAQTYSWNNNMNGPVITVSPFSQTNYTVTGTDQFGCKNTATVQVRVQTCVGISDLSPDQKQVTVYPNPNNGIFTIQSDVAMDLMLFNEIGQLVKTFSLTEANAYSANIQDLSNGIYFLKGNNGDVSVTQKIVVQK